MENQIMVLPLDKTLKYELIRVNKFDTGWCYNPQIEKVSFVEDKSNQLYAQNTKSFKQYDEICNYNYKIKNISLEYDFITQPDFARRIAMEYQIMVLPQIKLSNMNELG